MVASDRRSRRIFRPRAFSYRRQGRLGGVGKPINRGGGGNGNNTSSFGRVNGCYRSGGCAFPSGAPDSPLGGLLGILDGAGPPTGGNASFWRHICAGFYRKIRQLGGYAGALLLLPLEKSINLPFVVPGYNFPLVFFKPMRSVLADSHAGIVYPIKIA